MCACLHDACTHDACMQDVGTYEACIYFACTCDACKKWGRTDERTDGKLNSRSRIDLGGCIIFIHRMNKKRGEKMPGAGKKEEDRPSFYR